MTRKGEVMFSVSFKLSLNGAKIKQNKTKQETWKGKMQRETEGQFLSV